MEHKHLDPRLRLIQNTDLEDKVVLVRFDHNVVKDGEIKDPYRIDRTLGTFYNIVERGGRTILATHIGRPKDKKTGEIKCKRGLALPASIRRKAIPGICCRSKIRFENTAALCNL
jgi:phosphoglycerate kinase